MRGQNSVKNISLGLQVAIKSLPARLKFIVDNVLVDRSYTFASGIIITQ
jgi:hypothetical protein